MIEILIAIIVAFCYGISAAIQKYSFTNMKKFSIRQMIKSWKWLVSMVIGGIGLIIYLYSLKFIPISTIQPLLALSITIPIIAGFLFFKERPNRYESLGVAFVIAGVIWISLM